VFPGVAGRCGAQNAFKPNMTFAAAVKNYDSYAYNTDGYVGKTGKVMNGGLGCSAFVSVVMHQMRDGKDFVSGDWDWRLHQKLGKDIAEHFKLPNAGEYAAKELDSPSQTAALLRSGKLAAGQIYLFDAHPGEGHTGFMRIKEDGQIEQWHYSGMSAYKGLATGDFHKWLEASQYINGKFTLFLLPQ
jgi:hypothetical protein